MHQQTQSKARKKPLNCYKHKNFELQKILNQLERLYYSRYYFFPRDYKKKILKHYMTLFDINY